MSSAILDNSILDDIKKLLGISIDPEEPYEYFDHDLVIHINSCFSTLRQLGIGPTNPFSISDESETWGDFFGDTYIVEMVRSWMYLKVKMMFDPPTSSIASEAYKAQIAEYEWRMSIENDTDWEDED